MKPSKFVLIQLFVEQIAKTEDKEKKISRISFNSLWCGQWQSWVGAAPVTDGMRSTQPSLPNQFRLSFLFGSSLFLFCCPPNEKESISFLLKKIISSCEYPSQKLSCMIPKHSDTFSYCGEVSPALFEMIIITTFQRLVVDG